MYVSHLFNTHHLQSLFSVFMVRPHPFLFSTELLTSCLPVSQRKCSCILCVLQLYSLYSKTLRLFFPYVCQPSPLRWVSDICHLKEYSAQVSLCSVYCLVPINIEYVLFSDQISVFTVCDSHLL